MEWEEWAAVVLLPLVEAGGDEQVVWLEIWFRIALELGPAGMDIPLAETSSCPRAACLLENHSH